MKDEGKLSMKTWITQAIKAEKVIQHWKVVKSSTPSYYIYNSKCHPLIFEREDIISQCSPAVPSKARQTYASKLDNADKIYGCM